MFRWIKYENILNLFLELVSTTDIIYWNWKCLMPTHFQVLAYKNTWSLQHFMQHSSLQTLHLLCEIIYLSARLYSFCPPVVGCFWAKLLLQLFSGQTSFSVNPLWHEFLFWVEKIFHSIFFGSLGAPDNISFIKYVPQHPTPKPDNGLLPQGNTVLIWKTCNISIRKVILTSTNHDWFQLITNTQKFYK